MGRRESWGGRLRGIPRSSLGLMLGGGGVWVHHNPRGSICRRSCTPGCSGGFAGTAAPCSTVVSGPGHTGGAEALVFALTCGVLTKAGATQV